MTTDAIERAASLLATAHRSGKPLALAQFPAPMTPAEAVGVQVRTMAILEERAGGWKVSMTPEGTAVPGVMYASEMHLGHARHVLMAGRSIGFEAEIAVRLGADLPPRPGKPYARAEIESAIGAALVGIEIVDSRFERAIKPPYLVGLADRIGNAGYVAGPDVASWRSLDLAGLRCRVTRDGVVMHDKVGGHPQNDPLLPLVRYASAQIEGGGLRRGQVVTLGSLIGLHWFDAPCRLRVTIDGLGEAGFDIVAQ